MHGETVKFTGKKRNL